MKRYTVLAVACSAGAVCASNGLQGLEPCDDQPPQFPGQNGSPFAEQVIAGGERPANAVRLQC